VWQALERASQRLPWGPAIGNDEEKLRAISKLNGTKGFIGETAKAQLSWMSFAALIFGTLQPSSSRPLPQKHNF
jgi:hypothetical protein